MAVGDRYEPEFGVLWSDGNETPSPQNPNPLPRGYYPLLEGGKAFDGSVRLRRVADPANPDGGWFEVMPREAGYGYYHALTPQGELPPSESAGGGGALGVMAPGPVVPLEGSVKGKASLAGRLARALRIRYILGRK